MSYTTKDYVSGLNAYEQIVNAVRNLEKSMGDEREELESFYRRIFPKWKSKIPKAVQRQLEFVGRLEKELK